MIDQVAKHSTRVLQIKYAGKDHLPLSAHSEHLVRFLAFLGTYVRLPNCMGTVKRPPEKSGAVLTVPP